MAQTCGASGLVPPRPPRLCMHSDPSCWLTVSHGRGFQPRRKQWHCSVFGPSGLQQLSVSMPLPVTRFLCHSKGTEVFVGVRFTQAMPVFCSTSFNDVCVSEHWETRCELVLCFVIKQFEDCLVLPVSVPPARRETLPSHAAPSPGVRW